MQIPRQGRPTSLFIYIKIHPIILQVLSSWKRARSICTQSKPDRRRKWYVGRLISGFPHSLSNIQHSSLNIAEHGMIQKQFGFSYEAAIELHHMRRMRAAQQLPFFDYKRPEHLQELTVGVYSVRVFCGCTRAAVHLSIPR